MTDEQPVTFERTPAEQRAHEFREALIAERVLDPSFLARKAATLIVYGQDEDELQCRARAVRRSRAFRTFHGVPIDLVLVDGEMP